jgi:hypothetical protein
MSSAAQPHPSNIQLTLKDPFAYEANLVAIKLFVPFNLLVSLKQYIGMAFFANSAYGEIICLTVDLDQVLLIFRRRKLWIGIQKRKKRSRGLERADSGFKKIPCNLLRPLVVPISHCHP